MRREGEKKNFHPPVNSGLTGQDGDRAKYVINMVMHFPAGVGS